ncbi:MAG: hypothetical protein GX363_06880 [Clostridiales bacterium]|nr:hypothetical protein [Clostridiales bacterium]
MSQMFVFHGVDSKVGTTMISQSVAELIADNLKDKKILFASLNGRLNDQYADHVGESIEGIKIYLDNKVLSTNELMESCKRTDNLYHIAGIDSIGVSRYYHPETAMYFLEAIEDCFDIIVVDSGNELDDGLAIGALEGIKEKFCIITQQESVLKRYEKLETIYKKLGISFNCVIINKYNTSNSYDLDYITNRLSISSEEIMKVEMTDLYLQAEMDCCTLIHYNDRNYINDIIEISNKILGLCNIDICLKRKRKWRSFI